jgi:hypothetical protein
LEFSSLGNNFGDNNTGPIFPPTSSFDDDDDDDDGTTAAAAAAAGTVVGSTEEEEEVVVVEEVEVEEGQANTIQDFQHLAPTY